MSTLEFSKRDRVSTLQKDIEITGMCCAKQCHDCGTSRIFYKIKVRGNIKRLTLNKVRGSRFGRNKPAIQEGENASIS